MASRLEFFLLALPQHAPCSLDDQSASLWRNRDYVLLWFGQLVSSLGTRVSGLAFPLLVLAVTGSAAEAGLVGAMRTIPFAVLVLPVGALIDRWDRKRVMIICDACRAVALGSIPIAMAAGVLSAAQLGAAAFVEGTFYTFFNVAETACLPRVVRHDQITSAVSFSNVTESVMQMAGPSVGGLLYAFGRAVPFLTDAISYATSVVTLMTIRTEFQGERNVPRRRIWHDVHEGVVWLWKMPLLRSMALMTGTLNVVSMGWVLMIVVLAQRLHSSSFAVGLVLAGGGVGSIVGSSLCGWLQRRFGLRATMLGAIWLWALTWPIYLIPSIPVMALADCLGFVGASVFMVTALGYRLTVTPDHLQGRVNAVYKLLAFGPEPLSLLLTGILIQEFGAPSTVLICMTPQVVLAVWATVSRRLRVALTSHTV
jgi:MFS family permease